MKRVRILLAFSRGSSLAEFRKSLEEEFDVIGTATDYRNLLAKALKSEPDLIVGDLALPLWNEPDLKRKLRHLVPKTRVLILSIDDDLTTELGSRKQHASGLMVRRTRGTKLREALHEFLDEQSSILAESADLVESGHDASKELTPRQREVLKLLAEGRTMKQTGEILNLTTRTIAFHKYKIMRDFELHSNLELLKLAIREHLVSAD